MFGESTYVEKLMHDPIVFQKNVPVLILDHVKILK